MQIYFVLATNLIIINNRSEVVWQEIYSILKNVSEQKVKKDNNPKVCCHRFRFSMADIIQETLSKEEAKK